MSQSASQLSEDGADQSFVDSSITSNAPEEDEEAEIRNAINSEASSTSPALTSWLEEASGGCGDLGTFIPLYVALCRQGSIHPTPALVWAGVCHAISGWRWDLPMPVQPMKSIAAAALIGNLDRTQVSLAGFGMGLLMTVLARTNGIGLLHRLVPLPVVSGVQLGVGIHLTVKGFHLIQELSWLSWFDCKLTAIITVILCLTAWRAERHARRDGRGTRRYALGLYLFLLGAIVSVVNMIRSNDQIETWSQSSFVVWAFQHARVIDGKTAFLEGVLPQLPLTALNSVISVCALAETLSFPVRRNESNVLLSRRDVCLSIGLMNLMLCPLGAMPNCHGAGGLAGQHKFGARRGLAVVILGLTKILLALALGSWMAPLLAGIPTSILGVLLATAGHELACSGVLVLLKQSDPQMLQSNVTVLLVTATVTFGIGKAHYGVLCGWVTHMFHSTEFSSAVLSVRRQTSERTLEEFTPIVR